MGNITTNKKNGQVIYSVKSIVDINSIIPHLEKYPLLHLFLFVVKSEYKRNELLPAAQSLP